MREEKHQRKLEARQVKSEIELMNKEQVLLLSQMKAHKRSKSKSKPTDHHENEMIRLKRVFTESKEKLSKLKSLEQQLSNYETEPKVEHNPISTFDQDVVVYENSDEDFDQSSQERSDGFARHTRGPVALPNGKVYTGQWVNDKRDGLGTLYWPEKISE